LVHIARLIEHVFQHGLCADVVRMSCNLSASYQSTASGQYYLFYQSKDYSLHLRGNLYRIIIAMAIQQLFNLGVSVSSMCAKKFSHRGHRVADMWVAVFGSWTAAP